MADLKASEPRRWTTSPSPLAAALAQAVIEQHQKRAGLAPSVDAVLDQMEHHVTEGAPVDAALGRYLEHPALTLIAGGREIRTEP